MTKMQFEQMKRREFIRLLGGTVTWPLAARAQQSDRARRIGVLMNLAVDDPEGQARLAAFAYALKELGWSEDRNLRIETRWGGREAYMLNCSEIRSHLSRRPRISTG